jgi:DNA-binding GntR family transcriptional regulator
MLVSRIVVREALMLLEEDGFIRARRGVGRFVSDTLPRIGIERIRPFEEVLGGPGHQVQIKRVQVEKQPASEFVAPGVQYVRYANGPFYLAKCLTVDCAGYLSVMQSLQPRHLTSDI